MRDLEQSAMDATTPNPVIPPVKGSRARRPKRKASGITTASADSVEGSATPVNATPVKKPRATKATKAKIVKSNKEAGAKVKIEPDGTEQMATLVKRVQAKTEKAAMNDINDSADEAAPSDIDEPMLLDDTADIDAEGESDLEFGDAAVVDAAEDSAFESTPVKKAKTEPKAKATKTKVEKAPAKSRAEKPKVEKAAKIKTEKVEKSKATKDSGAKAGAKDKKEKVEQVIGDAAMQLLKNYLSEQNRPYNGTDISTNLHGKIKKTLADKLLQDLAASGQIMGKASGKAWVYWCIQDPNDAASPEQLAILDSTITSLRDQIPTLKSQSKNLTTQLTILKSAPTTSELLSQIKQLQASNANKRAKLTSFTSGNVAKIPKQEMDRVENEWLYWGKKKAARKTGFENIEYELRAGMSHEEIWEKYTKNLSCDRAVRLMIARAGIEGEDD